ncbi:MAG TPA: ATP-binding cassette domain-containing protein [Rhodocyclaceae bacterium]|nr:ATP-binding cassette domain-containing protein [Rhodocyclaceae bacterium]
MPLLTLENACLAFGHVALLDHAAFQIDPGERVALIGRNGCGKSSLMRVLEGSVSLDDGIVWRQPGMRLAYVPQEPVFLPESSVFEVIAQGLGAASRLLLAYHETAHAVALDPSVVNLAALQELQEQLDHADGWLLSRRVEQAISRLGLDAEAKISTLSGGGIKRVALGQALASEPDVLLLDEPTNHLDIDGISWLESLIRDFRGGVLVITHDRSFLDAVATRVVELDRGRLASYPGSFNAYQERKAAELAAEEQSNAKFDKFLAQEEVWIRKGVEARRTRNEGRVLRLEGLRRERSARRDRLGSVELNLARGEKSGKLVAELEGVTKCYGERIIVRDFSCRILRGDKIGLIGPNGIGKTTLLKLILGEIPADSGSVRLGTKQEVAYFDQFRSALDEEAALVDVISPGSDFVEISGQRKHVISYLGDFLFAPERARSPVKSLSGGERNRLLLARLFARPANVLVLDEPTNDLDIETLELLESLLQEYMGTLFLVSHDRSFLDNVVTQCIVAEGDGIWREYAGGYNDWLAAKRRAPRDTAANVSTNASPARAPIAALSTSPPSPARQRNKLNYRETQELTALPDRIGALETERSTIVTRLADATLYRDMPEEAKRLQTRANMIDGELAQMLSRWEELEMRGA